MLAPFISAIKNHGKAKDPKAYKVRFVDGFTILGGQRGEGWYITTPSWETIGPLPSQESAERVLFSALEELRGKPIGPEERKKAHEQWAKH